MSHLKYSQGTYFRSAQTDAESFRPYLLSMLSIVFVTFFAVGVQTTVVNIHNSGTYSLGIDQTLCRDLSNIYTCLEMQKEENTKGYLEGDLPLEQDLQRLIN